MPAEIEHSSYVSDAVSVEALRSLSQEQQEMDVLDQIGHAVDARRSQDAPLGGENGSQVSLASTATGRVSHMTRALSSGLSFTPSRVSTSVTVPAAPAATPGSAGPISVPSAAAAAGLASTAPTERPRIISLWRRYTGQ